MVAPLGYLIGQLVTKDLVPIGTKDNAV